MTLRTVFSALFADYGAVFTTAATHTNYDAVVTQIAVVTVTPVARAIVAYSATFAKFIVALRTSFSAIGTNKGAVFASFVAPHAHYRTIAAQIAIRTESVIVCALVAYSTVFAEIIVTLRTTFSAIRAKDGAPFARFAAAKAHYRTIATQITAITETIFTARAIVAYSATFTKIIVTLRTKLSAVGTKDGAVFAKVATAQTHYRTIAAQRAIMTEISIILRAFVAYSATLAKFIVTLGTAFSA